jgi:hypothetical protein
MKILMNHLPKCAGNAVAQHFKTLFGEAGVYEVRTSNGLAGVPDLAPYQFVFGHMPLSWDEQFGAGRQRFSLMREPVDRVLSAYFFFAHLKEHNSPVVAKVPMMSLEEYVNSDSPEQKMTTCNEQSRQLLGLQGPGTQDPEQAIKFVAERVHLLDRFFTVGIYERLQESLDVVSWQLKLPRLRSGMVANRTPRSWHGDKFDQSIIEAIRKRNLIDLELYRIVNDRFSRQSGFMQDELLSGRYFQNVETVDALPYKVDMGTALNGSGWYSPQTNANGTFRWMGGRDGASLYLPVSCRGTLTVRVLLDQVSPAVDPDGISLYLDGEPMVCGVEMLPGRRAVLVGKAWDAPMRLGHVLTIFTSKWRQPTPEDGRTLALAVSSIELQRAE